jgi:hypothetical protein
MSRAYFKGLVGVFAVTVGCSNASDDKDSHGGSDDDDSAAGTTTGSSANTTTGSPGMSGTATDADGSDESTASADGTDSNPSTSGPMGTSTGDGTDTMSGDDDGTIDFCQAPGNLTPCDAQTDNPFQALGLDCPGGPNEMIPIHNETFFSQDAAAWRIAKQFGTAVDGSNFPVWAPREGEQFLLLTTGRLTEVDDDGRVIMEPGSTQYGEDNDNANAEDKPLPAPMTADEGSNGGGGGTPFVNCDGVRDCSDSLAAQWTLGGGSGNDMVWFQFNVQVPGGTHSFSFDFAYFSAEFPEYVDTTFNDVFVVWSTSETYTGNLCFVDGQPCTVTALWPVAYTETAPELVGTGFDTAGGGTGWYQAKGSVEPNEWLQLTWALFDMGDSVLDTAVIIDNFQWGCEGCTPTEVDPCVGIDPI